MSSFSGRNVVRWGNVVFAFSPTDSKRRTFLTTLCSALFFMLASPDVLFADGGRVWAMEDFGGYRVSVFTEPANIGMGPVDVSVLVQADGEIASDVEVEVEFAHADGTVLHGRASKEAATNKLFQAVRLDISAPGEWKVHVRVNGPQGRGDMRFAVTAASFDRAGSLWPWMLVPFAAMGLFAIHLRLSAYRQTRELAQKRAKHVV